MGFVTWNLPGEEDDEAKEVLSDYKIIGEVHGEWELGIPGAKEILLDFVDWLARREFAGFVEGCKLATDAKPILVAYMAAGMRWKVPKLQTSRS